MRGFRFGRCASNTGASLKDPRFDSNPARATSWFQYRRSQEGWLVLSALAICAQTLAAPKLPQPPPFQGTIGFTAKDSVADRPQPAEAPQGAPNILLILLDDVGFADTSTFGGPSQTPALDQLAAQGLRYNQFHTTGLCSPTRAALLSGRNHHRVGFGGFGGAGFPGYDGIWKKNIVPIAEVLRRNGYSTAAFGKWHNTPSYEVTPVGPFDRWPTGLGFEYFYGFMLGMSSQWEPLLWRNTTQVPQPKRPSEGYHLTKDLVDDAIAWMGTHESLAPSRPYFLYFATGAAHTPHHVPKEWTDKYRGQFDQGWDVLRRQIFERQKKMGVVPADAALTPRPLGIPAWSSLSSDERKLFARQMEVFAAFVAHTDYEVGRLIRAAQEAPQGANTLIIYIVGDNGNDPAGGRSGTNNLLAVMSGVPTSLDEQLHAMDTWGDPKSNTTHYANGWAWMGSTPLKWMKYAASHFGGTSNPMVVSWPARIKDRGGLRPQFAHVVDIAPTLYEAIGIPFPDVVDGVRQVPLDGASLVSTFDSPSQVFPSRAQYFEIAGNRAVYRDGWVAAALHTNPLNAEALEGSPDFSHDRWELYHISEDFSEAHDLAARDPQELHELQAVFDREARDNQVYPLGAPASVLRQPTWLPKDGHFFYRADFSGVPVFTSAIPDFRKSHRTVAEAVIPREGASGAIMAAGGRDGGFVLYLKDGFLTYESNYFNKEHTRIVASRPLRTGEVKLGYELSRDTDATPSGGTVRLYVEDRVVAEGHVPTLPIPDVLDNFDIGQDSASPVSDAYAPPFKFSGVLKDVRVDLVRTELSKH